MESDVAEGDEAEFKDFIATQRALLYILFMYRELLSYRGLHCDFSGWDDGEFDPLDYVDIPDDRGYGQDDVRLLREGSAIKILCSVLQCYAQADYPQSKIELMHRIEAAHAEGRLHYVPDLAQALAIGLKSERGLQERSAEIFQQYVLGYFRDLIRKADGDSPIR